MALMIATLIERQLRLAMEKHSIESLPIYPEQRPCPSPTVFDIVRLFKSVEKYEVLQDEAITVFPAHLSQLQKQVLELLEVPRISYQ